ncbi:MAG: tyrosine-type recombinase/integrase [Burkholderiales bacterium]|nr:tyrosine-type recombinase/integrase [Burkholderiales bacterium]
MKLNKTIIDKLKYIGNAEKNERCIVWADEPSGLGVRVYPSGKKAFVFSYRHEGRKQLKTIGRYGDITLSQAENQVKKDIAALLDNKNPLTERNRARLGASVKHLCDLYITQHASRKKTGKEDIRRINQRILPAWSSHKIKSITRQDVIALHSKIGKSAPYEANRVLALVSKLFNFAVHMEIVDAGHPNPASGVTKFKEKKRDRYVTENELPKLIEAIQNEPNQSARYAFWLYLLTGVRKEELLTVKWSDIVELGKNYQMRIEETKNDKTHYLPLSDAAMAILKQIPRIEGNSYIIVGKNKGAHLVNISKAWRRIRVVAGIEDVRLHDLRRTVGSWLAQAGNSLHLIGKVLNHSNASTTAIYARFGQDTIRNALDSHGKQILSAAGMKDEEKLEISKTSE